MKHSPSNKMQRVEENKGEGCNITLAFDVSKSATFPWQCDKCEWWFREVVTIGDQNLCARCAKPTGEAINV